jgi:hypothetical protein
MEVAMDIVIGFLAFILFCVTVWLAGAIERLGGRRSV